MSCSIEKKKRIISRLNEMRNQDDLKKIRDIILKDNPMSEHAKNNNGTFFLQPKTLKDSTYLAVEKFLIKLDKQKIKSITSELINTSDLSNEFSSEKQSDVKPGMSKKLRLTNTENHILNRAKYEKDIKENERNVLNLPDEEYHKDFPEEIKPKDKKVNKKDKDCDLAKDPDVFCRKIDKKHRVKK